nr:hypothetical protein CFP56_68838 [Quercus suber]
MSWRPPAYTHSFTMDGVPLLATNRVRPWREGRGGKVAKSVGEALLLPKDIKHWAKWDDESLLLNMKREAIMERYQAAKARAKELSNDNEDLLKKISDVMNKVSESKRFRSKVEENTKSIMDKADAFEKELQEARTALYDCTSTVKPEVQQNFQVYFTKGWIVVLDKLEVEAASSLRQERNVPILTKLVIIPNPEIQAIINDKSPIKKVERAGPTTTCGGEATTYAALSLTKELHV